MNRSTAPALLSILLATSLLLPQATAQQVTVPVVEDSWISGPGTSVFHGNDLALGICPALNYWIYLKFDLSTVPGDITDAELRMTRIDGVNPQEISLYLITDDSWSEATMTGANIPEPTDPPNSSALASGAQDAVSDFWASAPLTQAIQGEALGDGTLTVMLRENPVPMFDIRHYRSREATVPDSQKPHLVVTCTTGELDGLVAAGGSSTMWSWNGIGATTSYEMVRGTLDALRTDGDVGGATCLSGGLSSPSLEDTESDPSPGQGRYYLVRASSGCGVGTFGSGSDQVERLPTSGCP